MAGKRCPSWPDRSGDPARAAPALTHPDALRPPGMNPGGGGYPGRLGMTTRREARQWRSIGRHHASRSTAAN
ncbi:hypothetical protein Ate01nite_70720 [Actinoplanes teichomyceticus]|nr:hypothetical protein Ate01nite_70720 [Actinoplanes teichomyceticus]